MKLNNPLVVALTCALAIALTPSAGAAVDTTRPKLTLSARAAFVSGTTIGAMVPDEDGNLLETRGIRRKKFSTCW